MARRSSGDGSSGTRKARRVSKNCTLALSGDWRVEALKTLLGKRLVRVTLAESIIDFVVTTPVAQKIWLETLQKEAQAATDSIAMPYGVPTHLLPPDGLLKRREQEEHLPSNSASSSSSSTKTASIPASVSSDVATQTTCVIKDFSRCRATVV